MNKEERIEKTRAALESFGARIYDYRGTKFIGIKNPYSDNNMAITFGDEQSTLEFAFQSERYEPTDVDDLISRAKKFLTDELVSAEFFLNGKSVFGGSRNSEGSRFKTTEEALDWYGGNNAEVAENLLKFIKSGSAQLKIASWSGRYDKVAVFDDKGEIIL